MKDNDLYVLLIATIEAAESGAGIPNVNAAAGVPVYQSYQPIQQGVATGPSAFLEIVGHKRYGSPERSNIWVPPDPPTPGEMVHTETQIIETTFQISALATQDPSNIVQYTAADIVLLLSYIMQSSSTIETLRAQDVGILRVMDIRNPKFLDDRDRFEASPSFDFTVTHKLIVTSEIPVLESENLVIIPI